MLYQKVFIMYSIDDLRKAVSTSHSISETLAKLGIIPAGGNYKTIKRKIKQLCLDTSHFTGKGHLKGKTHTWTIKIKLKDILVENSNYQSNKLRKRLLEEGMKEHRCENCQNETWLGAPIPLELDHINGINTDNRIENLKLLCPNCHALTPTYRGKNKKS